ncbi:MAG: hypothetical protein ACFE7R_07680, partial [Candidatus Hodarchaeota archaeon]
MSDRLDLGLRNLLDKAIDLDNRGMKKEAAQYYLKASKILIKLSNAATLPSLRKHYLDRAQECVDRVRYISGIKKKARGPVDGLSTPPVVSIEPQEKSIAPPIPETESEEDDDTRRLQEMISDTILYEKPSVGMSEVA